MESNDYDIDLAREKILKQEAKCAQMLDLLNEAVDLLVEGNLSQECMDDIVNKFQKLAKK